MDSSTATPELNFKKEEPKFIKGIPTPNRFKLIDYQKYEKNGMFFFGAQKIKDDFINSLL